MLGPLFFSDFLKKSSPILIFTIFIAYWMWADYNRFCPKHLKNKKIELCYTYIMRICVCIICLFNKIYNDNYKNNNNNNN